MLPIGTELNKFVKAQLRVAPLFVKLQHKIRMLSFISRRLLISIPTLIIISLVIFLLLNLAPNDPMAQVPLTVPPEVKQKMREALGLGQPLYIQFLKWLIQFFWIEPQVFIDYLFDTSFSEGKQRVISWQTRSPVMDIIVQRMPQTLWVVGMSYVVGILIAIPIGIYTITNNTGF